MIITQGRYAISGCHSSGKTTLLNNLIDYYNVTPIAEVASHFTERDKPQTQLNILNAQIHAEKHTQYFFSDRTVIDNLAYMNLIQKISGEDNVIYNTYIKIYNEYLRHRPYDVIFFVDEILPYKHASHRTFSEQWMLDYIYETIKSHLKDARCDVVYISGTTEERTEEVLKHVWNERAY